MDCTSANEAVSKLEMLHGICESAGLRYVLTNDEVTFLETFHGVSPRPSDRELRPGVFPGGKVVPQLSSPGPAWEPKIRTIDAALLFALGYALRNERAVG